MDKYKYKRVLVILFTVLMAVTLFSGPAYALKQTFKDVPPSAWFYKYVENLYSKNIVGGFGTTGQFRPHNNVQRQHAAKMIVKAAEIPYEGKKAKFSDVPPNHEMSPFIGAMQERGIVNGKPGNKFAPTHFLTRAEASVMIAKAFGLKMYGTSPNLNDVRNHWAKDEIEILLSNGIVKGYGNGIFNPGKAVTRAELSKMINVAMVVKAVQKAELLRSKSAGDAAKKLIDTLPTNQDQETREQLLNRWMASILPNRDGGWQTRQTHFTVREMLIFETHCTWTAHYNEVVDNYDDLTGKVEKIAAIYFVIEATDDSYGTSIIPGSFELTDSSGNKHFPVSVSKTSSIGKLGLKSYSGQYNSSNVSPGRPIEGYVFFKMEGSAVPVQLAWRSIGNIEMPPFFR